MYKVNLAATCNTCKTQAAIEVNYVDLLKYQQGHLIQNCFPYLSANDRELIISKTCPACWEKLFGSDDEDDIPNFADEITEEEYELQCAIAYKQGIKTEV